MDELIDFIRNYVFDHQAEYREWLKEHGKEDGEHEEDWEKETA